MKVLEGRRKLLFRDALKLALIKRVKKAYAIYFVLTDAAPLLTFIRWDKSPVSQTRRILGLWEMNSIQDYENVERLGDLTI